MATDAIWARKLGRGCLWASREDAVEAAAGRMAHTMTLTGSWPTSGLTSRASPTSILYATSEASSLPVQMGARGRQASCARDGRGGRTRGGALQKLLWSAVAILPLCCDMKSNVPFLMTNLSNLTSCEDLSKS